MGHVASKGVMTAVYRDFVGKLKERDFLGDPGIDGRLILRCIFRTWVVGVWSGSSWLRIGIGDRYL